MKEMKMSTDILTSLAAVFLSIFLIALTVGFGLLYPFSSLFTGKSFSAVAAEVGAEALKQTNDSFKEVLKEYGFNDYEAQELLESDAAAEVFDLYLSDIKAKISGEEKSETEFNSKNVQAAMALHLDELVNIAVEKGTETEEALKEESKIVKSIKASSQKIVESMPKTKDVYKQISKSGFYDAVSFLIKPSLFKIWLWVILIVSVLIFICRMYRCWGLVWIGTDLVISAVLMIVAVVLSFVGAIDYFISDFVQKVSVLDSMGTVYTKLLIGECIAVILLFTIIFILYGKIKKYFNSHFNEN